eukprot:TRINITY_DN45614_c0_g1_i1.p1 TRINITY_DN45614_c0_g1~~TRINITY_DN45614_c0_g1_i1.p1  ORF type:complete len:711 (-),score=179.24 TRINITY_DN45614_c0_g1_i1:223-2355(-)
MERSSPGLGAAGKATTRSAAGGGGAFFRQLKTPGSSRPSTANRGDVGFDSPPFSPFTSVEFGSSASSVFRCTGMQASTATWPAVGAWSGTSAVTNLRWGQILVPDDGPENDVLRLRNGGRMLFGGRKAGDPKHSPRQLRRKLRMPATASAPMLATAGASPSLSSTAPATAAAVSTGSVAGPGGGGGAFGTSCSSPALAVLAAASVADTAEGSASAAARVETPRTQNGLLRKSAPLAMWYDPHEIEPQPPPDLSLQRSVRPRPPVPSHLVKGGKVILTKEDTSLLKSKRLLQSLYDLRRAGKDGGDEAAPPKEMTAQEAKLAARAAASPPPAPSAKKQKEEDLGDMPLLQALLRGRDDTIEFLTRMEQDLVDAAGPVSDNGGARHASNVIANRTLLVARRKLQLVQALETRYNGFKKAHEGREELIKGIIGNTCKAPPEMQGVKQFVNSLLHKGGGEPVDADKSDFKSFANSFGLPQGHKFAVGLNTMGKEASKWWSERALDLAKDKSAPEAIIRVLDVMKGLGVEADNESSKECLEILGERLATQVLEFAMQTQERDEAAQKKAEERGEPPQIKSARNGAEAINKQLSDAFALGCPTKHRSCEEAKKIANYLLTEGNARVAMKAFQYAKGLFDKDTALSEKVEAGGKIPQVGPASKMADDIEREVQNAEKDGAPRSHPYISQAMELAKSLRDRDGQRKRLEAREKRKAGG